MANLGAKLLATGILTELLVQILALISVFLLAEEKLIGTVDVVLGIFVESVNNGISAFQELHVDEMCSLYPKMV